MTRIENMDHDTQWYDKQYDPRPSDGSLDDILADWGRRSKKLRSTTTNWETVSYGHGDRATADIYRADEARGFLIFFHGGYWHSCSKDEHGWIAQAFLESGISTAIINYPLCPDVTLQEIVRMAHLAFITLYREVMTENERSLIIISGHSAGGYLAATHLVTDWTEYKIPESPFKCMVCISGLFDLMPLVNTSMNVWLRLTPELASKLSLVNKRPYARIPMIFGIGGQESEEFHRQSTALSQAWRNMPVDIIDVKGKNHFNVLEDFATREGSIHRKILSIVYK